MHEQTPLLATQVRRLKSIETQSALLRNRYEGATCVIVTCGPSLAAVPPVALRRRLEGVLTIAVKQALIVTGDQTDFHCWNSFNVTRFARPSDSTLRCLVADPTGSIRQWNRRDLEFPHKNGHGQLTNSLAFRRDFADHLIADSPVRPFGPGIMYELAFYLAVHLGVSEIVTVGWDIASSSGRNTHFYDTSKDTEFFERGRTSATPAQQPSVRSRLPQSLQRAAHGAKTAYAHVRHDLYNRTASLVGESDLVGESTVELAQWLRSSGVGLTAVTESDVVGEHIPRIGVSEFLGTTSGR